MTTPDFNWTFEAAPTEPEPPPGAPEAERPRLRRPQAWRRWALWLLALGLVGALGVGLFQWAGWRRLEQQVAREVAYEDAYALEGNAAAVVAVQSMDSEAWRSVRQAEAGQRLPAALPAAHLAPAGPGRLLRLRPLGGTFFVATVRREYVDALGERYAFDLAQYYRNLSPGVWERIPPWDALRERVPTNAWAGRRLRVDGLPQSEAEALEPVLQQADAWLAQACETWRCPDDLTVPLVYTIQPANAPSPARPAWETQPELGRYPPAFDVAAAYPLTRTAEPIVLPALALVGHPTGEAERQALAGAVAGRGLYYLAAWVSAGHRQGGGPLEAALVARAEARFGQAPAAGPFSFAPNSGSSGWLLTPEIVWGLSRQERQALTAGPGQAGGTAASLYALSFLNFALEGQAPATDGALLAGLHGSPGLEAWLARGLGPPAASQALAEWAARVAADSGAEAITDASLDGLVYACGDRLWVARAGAIRPLEAGVEVMGDGLISNFAAGDGFLAFVAPGTRPVTLRLVDLERGTTWTVDTGADYVQLLGWSAAGHLLYLDEQGGGRTLLSRYDPARDGVERVLEQSVRLDMPLITNWTADRTAIGVLVNSGEGSALGQWRPAVVTVTDPVTVIYLGEAGSAAAVSPGGQYAAYFNGPGWFDESGAPSETPSAIVVAVVSQPPRVVLVVRPVLATGEPAAAGFIVWAPDGREFVYAAGQIGAEMGLYAQALAGGESRLLDTAGATGLLLPIGFSADGQFLLYIRLIEDGGSEVALAALDWQTGRRLTYQPANQISGFAWSAAGHLLALGTQGGLLVADPSSGAMRWLSLDRCSGLAWQPAPARP